MHVRTFAGPTGMAAAVRERLRALDKNLPMEIRLFSDLVDDNLAQERLIAALSGFFAGLALLLTATGLYGVIAYSVVLRTHEIGIRAALGASSVKLATLVAGQGLVLSLLGLLLGSLVALGVARFLQSLLFGVGTVDAITWSGAGVVVLAVAILAGIIPARAAARVDPLEALRAE